MAKAFNFLKGTMSGKVGNTYYRQHQTYARTQPSNGGRLPAYRNQDIATRGGDCVVYLRIQKQHADAVQKKCWTAFKGLQRLAAAFCKYHWSWLGLSDKNRNKVNVCAEFLKCTVQNRVFNPMLIYNDFPEIDGLTLGDPIFDEERQVFTLNYQNAIAVDASQQPLLLFTIFQSNGINEGYAHEWQQENTFAFPTKFQNGAFVYALALLSVVQKGKRKIVGSKITASNYSGWRGQTWLPNRMANGNWWFADPKKTCGIGVNYQWSGKALILTRP